VQRSLLMTALVVKDTVPSGDAALPSNTSVRMSCGMGLVHVHVKSTVWHVHKASEGQPAPALGAEEVGTQSLFAEAHR
jgi:hypothetical protein